MSAPAHTPPARRTLEVQPTPQHVSATGAALPRILAEKGVPPDTASLAELAAVELLFNIVRHGATRAPIRLSLQRRQRALSIAITDDGPPFDMATHPCALPQDLLRESGRGLWIVRHAADRFRYRCCRGRNIHVVLFSWENPDPVTGR